jgi:hypothetical protein
MRTGGSRPSGRTRDLPVSDAVPLHVMCSSTPAGRVVPRIAALLVLRSTTTTASAPAMRQFRGSIDTPCNCCVRFVAVVTEAHATLTTERPATAFSGRSSTGWTAPAKLTPSVVVSRSVITYSAPSVPLAGTAQLHRTATYMCCLSCAGAPRPPASGSGLSLTIPSWHAVLYDPGEFDILKFQRRDVDIGLRRDLSGSALPMIPQIRFTRGTISRLPGSHIRYGLSGCSPP